MFDVLDYIPETVAATGNGQAHNQQKLADVAAYKNLTDNWDEDGATAPDHLTIVVALDIALLLIAHGQTIYHTSPGPAGEIMLNLRQGERSVEFLVYPNDKRKIVRVGGLGTPWQGMLTPETLRESLQWLNS